MNAKVFTLNAFAKTANGGNPAGVVLNSDNLSDEQKLLIAKKVGFSETAFVQKTDKANFKVKFFTPNAEVDLCGHATIATFYLLASQQVIPPGKYTQETKAGLLGIEILPDGTVFMEQNLPQYFDIVNNSAILESLNLKADCLINNLPLQIVSTGLKDVLIPINSLKELEQIKPNFALIKNICQNLGVVGYHLFTLETKFGATAHCRNFAPLYEINEEAATGTSNGALSCYLFKHGAIKEEQVNNLVFEQGYTMNRPSEIRTKLEIDNNIITRVSVGGTAANIQKIEVEI